MKKHIAILILLFAAVFAGAQEIRYIYVPGDNEHQMGLLLGTAIGSQTVMASAFDYHQPLQSAMGFEGGAFWGYETDHGTLLEFGNYTMLLYSLSPFRGILNGMRTVDGADQPFSHHFSLQMQSVRLYENPFLAYRINDEITLNAGVGIGITTTLPSRYKIDDIVGRSRYNFFTSLCFDLDANLGVKYFITDDLFVGMQVQYAFYTFDIRKLMESSFDPDVVGAIKMNEEGSDAVLIPNARPFHIMLSFGHRW